MGAQHGAWSASGKQLVAKSFVIDYTSGLKNILVETDAKTEEFGAQSRKYVYGLQKVSAAISQESPGLDSELISKLYLHHDRLGSVGFATDAATGAVLSRSGYDTWGRESMAEELSVDGESWAFTEYTVHAYDPVLGLYYAKARMYDAENRRFVAVDPLKGFVENPMTMIQYVYVLDNSLKYIDPWGLANYQIGGLSLAPTFAHDAGFIYDPNAIATDSDYESWNEWGRNAFFAGLVPWLRDASKMYSHYRDNTGSDISIDYTRAYKGDKTIKSAINSEISLMKDFAISAYSNDNMSSFEIIGDLQGIENGSSENWQKTIGAHYVYGHGVVTVDTKTGMATMIATFYMEDLYNFNPGQKDLASGTPDDVNGRFAELGWAKEFKVCGSMTKTITWQITALSSMPGTVSKEAGR
jgi:RHS repeat-associated protein